MDFKNYYKIPSANPNIISKAINKYKRYKTFLIVLNSLFFWILLYLFLMSIIALNIDILDILINLYYSLWLAFTLTVNILLWILLFLNTHYILILWMWISLILLNLIYVRKAQI